MRPRSPALFRQGAAAGPRLLLERQRGAIAHEADLKQAWKAADKAADDKGKKDEWPWSMPLPCRGCSDDAVAAGVDEAVSRGELFGGFPALLRRWLQV